MRGGKNGKEEKESCKEKTSEEEGCEEKEEKGKEEKEEKIIRLR